jgi:hypothetical protein
MLGEGIYQLVSRVVFQSGLFRSTADVRAAEPWRLAPTFPSRLFVLRRYRLF